MEYWHFTGNHLHVTDCSLYSWIKPHNLERECCNKPYNWKIAIRWYFTTRKGFLSKLAYWRPFIFTDWLVTRSSISVFPNVHVIFFSNTLTNLWAGHSSSETLQWQEPKKRRRVEMLVLDLLKSDGFWQMQDISKHVLFTNSEFNCLRCYFSLSGYPIILLVYTFNFHLLHIKYFTVFSPTNYFPTRHFYHWSSSCIFAMKRLKSCV